MASKLTAEDFKAVEDHLQKEYFLVRGQAVALVVAFLVACGLGTIGASWLTVNQVIDGTVGKEAERRIKALLAEAESNRNKVAEVLAAAIVDRGEIAVILAELKKRREDALKTRIHIDENNAGITANGQNPPGDDGHYLKPEITLNFAKDTRVLAWYRTGNLNIPAGQEVFLGMGYDTTPQIRRKISKERDLYGDELMWIGVVPKGKRVFHASAAIGDQSGSRPVQFAGFTNGWPARLVVIELPDNRPLMHSSNLALQRTRPAAGHAGHATVTLGGPGR